MAEKEKSFLHLAEWKPSATDWAIQGMFALSVATSGIWQNVPIAFLIPAIVLTVAGVASLIRRYRDSLPVAETRDPISAPPLDRSLQQLINRSPYFDRRPLATPAELQANLVYDRMVRLNDIPRDDRQLLVIRGKHFRDCSIIGPGLIVPLRECTLIFEVNESDVERLLWRAGSSGYRSGAIGLESCSFQNCELIVVGIGGTEEALTHIKQCFITRDSHPSPLEASKTSGSEE